MNAPDYIVRNSDRAWTRLLYVAILGAGITGVLWLIARYAFAQTDEFGAVLPAWATRVTAIHGAFAMLTLIAFGTWLPTHVMPRLRSTANRASGLWQIASFGALAVTGYALYYIADERTRPIWSTAHWIIGLALIAAVLVHRRRATT